MTKNISNEERLRRSKNMSKLNKERTIDIPKDRLVELYTNQKMYIDDVAKEFGTSAQTIARRLQEYGIPKNGVRKPHKEIFTKEELIDLYINKNYSRQYIIDNYNITKKQLLRLLGMYEIKKPKKLERENYKKTMIERYGVNNAYASDDIKEKIKQTNLKRYGVEWYCETEHAKEANKPYKISKVNRDMSSALLEHNIKNVLEYKNFDISITDTDIVIEINPSYTHNSTNGAMFGNVNKEPITYDYHQNKSKKAKELGLRCIHIFDWDSWTKIINMLQPKETLYARKCELREVSTKECNEFLNMYHLQGTCQKQDIRLGLYYNNELVELMTFGKPRYNKKYEYELLRLCSHKDYSVTGGTQRLFKYFIDTYKPQLIISYCDTSKFDGNVYERLGFELKSESKPSKHWYNEKTSRHITDNLLRQRGFDQLFGTSYGKGTSNEELMIEHGFVEVFDCGQNTYVYERKDDN